MCKTFISVRFKMVGLPHRCQADCYEQHAGSMAGLWLRSLLLCTLLLAGCTGTVLVKPAKDAASSTLPAPIDAEIQKQFQQGMKLLEEKSYAEAVSVFEAITTKQPALAGPFVNLGIAQTLLAHYPEAEKALLAALKINPLHLAANNRLGLLYRRLGRFNEARLAYERALQADPTYLLAYLNLGVLCDRYIKDSSCALEHLEKYQSLRTEEDKQVSAWLADIKQRMASPAN